MDGRLSLTGTPQRQRQFPQPCDGRRPETRKAGPCGPAFLKHGDLTPDQARDRARKLAAMVTQGIDPRQRELDALAAQDEAQRRTEARARLDADLAFESVAARWLEHYEIGHRPRSYGQAKLVIDKHLPPILQFPTRATASTHYSPASSGQP